MYQLYMWYGRERGSYITGLEPVQRIGVYLDRENEDKIRNRNVQNSRLRNLTGYGTQLHARTSAPHCARFNGPAERVGVFWTVQRLSLIHI